MVGAGIVHAPYHRSRCGSHEQEAGRAFPDRQVAVVGARVEIRKKGSKTHTQDRRYILVKEAGQRRWTVSRTTRAPPIGVSLHAALLQALAKARRGLDNRDVPIRAVNAALALALSAPAAAQQGLPPPVSAGVEEA